MTAWGEHGRWDSKVKYVKRMDVNSTYAVYEIKGFQERVLFVRSNDDAIAFEAFIKKDDWSKKDQATLDAAVRLLEDVATAFIKGRGR